MDGFYTGNPDGDGSDEFALGYYLKEDLGFLPHAADAFTLYDRWFCSIMASTYPNRHYQLAAQNGGQKSNVLPVAETRADDGLSVGDDPRPRAGARADGRLLRLRPAVPGALRPRAGSPGCARRRSSTPTPPPAPAADLLRRPAVSRRRRRRRDLGRRASRTATSASARRSCPTSPTPSSSRRSTGAARCSSTTTSGAGSSTTCGPRHVPDDREQPQRPRRGLVADRLPDPGGRDLALRARGKPAPGQPHDLHPRVDPEADLLPLRARLPEQAPPLRVQHRPQLQLLEARLRAARAARPGGDRGDAVLGRAAARGRRSTTWCTLETSGLLDRLGYEVPKVTYDSLFRYPDTVRRAFEIARG